MRFLTDDLTTPNQFGENNGKNPGTDSGSYMGVCRLQDHAGRLYRRIDINAYPATQGPLALLYFTGAIDRRCSFNRSPRRFAKNAGLAPSDAGLSACTRRWTTKGWKRAVAGPSVRCNSEEDVLLSSGLWDQLRYTHLSFLSQLGQNENSIRYEVGRARRIFGYRRNRFRTLAVKEEPSS